MIWILHPGSRVEGIKSREEAERLADGLLHWVADVYDIIFRLEPIDGFNIDEATKEVEPLIYGP